MIKKIGKIILVISLLSIINIDKVNAEEEKLLSELILGENNNNVITEAPNFTNSLDRGLYVQNGDSTKSIDGKATYYFRGSTTNDTIKADYEMNNYVEFGTYKTNGSYTYNDLYGTESTFTYTIGQPILWRIVRINEDGSIRLISENSISDKTQFNLSENVKYVEDNGTDSKIKEHIDTWYSSNIGINTTFDNKVVTSNFCSDISGIDFTSSSMPGNAYTRYTNKTPTFICPDEAVEISSKVGLITLDEVLYSGQVEDFNNRSYLSSNQSYWTITPYNSNSLLIINTINASNFSPNNELYTRVVINLDSRVLATGTGTETDPYVISEKLYEESKQEETITKTYLNIKMDSNSKKENIEKVVKDNTTTYFEVLENNTFPGEAKVSVTGKYNNGSKIWLYKYNKETNKIEYVKNNIGVTNGEVIIEIDKSGEYFFTANEIDSSILSEQLGINLVYIIVFLSTILIGGFWVFKYAKERANKL